jgi:hypothetical protein
MNYSNVQNLPRPILYLISRITSVIVLSTTFGVVFADEYNISSQHLNGSSEMKVYVDPETGEILKHSSKNAASLTLEKSTTVPDLPEEVASPVTGGGTMVDVKGRFQTPLKATINADGNVVINHNE